MNAIFDPSNANKIATHFGEAFYNHVNRTLPILTEKWHLSNLSLIDSFSAGLLFKATSNLYGDVVLKYTRNAKSFTNEINALTAFNSESICKVLQSDFKSFAILQEQLQPGTTLADEKDIEKRLRTFCDLYQNLYKDFQITQNTAPKDTTSYTQWVHRITDFMSTKPEWDALATHMKAAQKRYDTLKEKYPQETLIHGDFHYYNILKHAENYKIIDPKGVMANPIFDLPRYMLNEFWDAKTHTEKDQTLQLVLTHFNKELGLSKSVLANLLYIETAMAICWDVEDGLELHKQDEMIKTLSHVASYTHY